MPTFQFAALYPLLHSVLQPTFPDCLWTGNRHRPEIALTFDDGPHPDHTPQLLSVLDRYQIPASFFWLGCCVQRCPEIAQGIYQRGHWVGLHGYDHQSFHRLSIPQLQRTLVQTQQVIEQSCGLSAERVRDVRPPNGFFTPKTLENLQGWGYRPVMWSVVPEDWVRPGVPVVEKRILQQTGNGSIIVLHDGYHGGQDVAATAAKIIPQLLALGYKFVTIEELWQQSS